MSQPGSDCPVYEQLTVQCSFRVVCVIYILSWLPVLSKQYEMVNCVCFCRFTLNSEVDLKTALFNMGLGSMFNQGTADFTRITGKL